jgi:hypothetical protein
MAQSAVILKSGGFRRAWKRPGPKRGAHPNPGGDFTWHHPRNDPIRPQMESHRPAAGFRNEGDRVHTPSITAVSLAGDSRLQAVDEAVSFWNRTLEEIGSGFRLGPIGR